MKLPDVTVIWCWIPRWVKISAVTAFIAFSAYLALFNYVELNHVGIARNIITGKVYLQQPGMYITAPWVMVSRIDTRPTRVCITTSGRGYNCKLVQFNPAHYQEFVAVEGFRYYWWANRISFNWGYDEEYRGMKDLLRGHAYGTKKYPFIIILEEYPDPSEG